MEICTKTLHAVPWRDRQKVLLRQEEDVSCAMEQVGRILPFIPITPRRMPAHVTV